MSSTCVARMFFADLTLPCLAALTPLVQCCMLFHETVAPCIQWNVKSFVSTWSMFHTQGLSCGWTCGPFPAPKSSSSRAVALVNCSRLSALECTQSCWLFLSWLTVGDLILNAVDLGLYSWGNSHHHLDTIGTMSLKRLCVHRALCVTYCTLENCWRICPFLQTNLASTKISLPKLELQWTMPSKVCLFQRACMISCMTVRPSHLFWRDVTTWAYYKSGRIYHTEGLGTSPYLN